MSEQKRKYSSRTVIAAQRRVLAMVEDQLAQMRPATLDRLRLDRGTGMVTLREVLEHVRGVRALQVTADD